MAGDTLLNKLKAIYKHMMLVGDQEVGSDGYFLLVVTGYIRFFDASDSYCNFFLALGQVADAEAAHTAQQAV
jgi:hypothetical protein